MSFRHYAVVRDADGAIVNRIVLGGGDFAPQDGYTLVLDEGYDIGGTYVGGNYFPLHTPEPHQPTPADTPLTMRQLRLGLLLIGGFPASYIQDAINAIPDATQRGVAQIWYDESATVDWSHPMTQQLIAGAGLTTEQAAAMWMQAKDLDA